jgi:ABC-2 type transport system permease protein
MHKLFAFLKRDLLTEVSYRFSFFFQLLSVLSSIASYYFLARFIGTAAIPELTAYGGDYFAFVLIGVALSDYLSTSLDAFSRTIRDSQLTGTLESLLATQTSLPTIILCSAVYPFVWTSFHVLLYLLFGVCLFGVHFTVGNWLAAGVLLLLSIVVFSGLGILSASFIMVFKRGSPVAWLFGMISWLLGGVMYPVSVLPAWLQTLAALLPITYAIEGMRAALLRGATWQDLWSNFAVLLLFAIVTLPLGLFSFHYATRRALITGTLGQY